MRPYPRHPLHHAAAEEPRFPPGVYAEEDGAVLEERVPEASLGAADELFAVNEYLVPRGREKAAVLPRAPVFRPAGERRGYADIFKRPQYASAYRRIRPRYAFEEKGVRRRDYDGIGKLVIVQYGPAAGDPAYYRQTVAEQMR